MKTYFLFVLIALLVQIDGNRQKVGAELIQRTMRDGVIQVIVTDGQILPANEKVIPEDDSIISISRGRLILNHR